MRVLILASLLFETILNLPSSEPTSVILLMLNPFTKIIIIMTHHLLQTVFCWWGDCELGQIKSNQSNSQIISDVNSTWIISLHLIWRFPTNQILESHFLNFIKTIKHFIISKWPQIILIWPQKNLSYLKYSSNSISGEYLTQMTLGSEINPVKILKGLKVFRN